MFRSTFVSFLLFLGSSAAYAGSCADVIQSKGDSSSRVGQARCSNCQNVAQFAKFGAAVLQKNKELTNRQRQRPRYDLLHVTNGDKAVEVSINALTADSGFDIPIGSWLGWNIPIIDTTAVLVSATPIEGAVAGSPWRDAKVSKNVLSATCTEIKRQQEEREQKNAERARLSRQTSSRGHRPSGDEVARLTAPGPYKWLSSRYNYSRCYTIWGPNGSITRCPRLR